jgi:hypothetical protein
MPLPLAASTIFVASSAKLAAVVEGADNIVTCRQYAAPAVFDSSRGLCKVSNINQKASSDEEKS